MAAWLAIPTEHYSGRGQQPLTSLDRFPAIHIYVAVAFFIAKQDANVDTVMEVLR
jgi:hypothetical protein